MRTILFSAIASLALAACVGEAQHAPTPPPVSSNANAQTPTTTTTIPTDATSFTIGKVDCAGCVKRVESVVAAFPGCTLGHIDLAAKTVDIQVPAGVDPAAVRTALTAAGYQEQATQP